MEKSSASRLHFIVCSDTQHRSETWKMTSRIAKKLDVFQQIEVLTKNTSCILSGPHHKRGDLTESWVKKTSWHSSWAEIQDGGPCLTSAWRETCKDSYDMVTVRREERKRTTKGNVEENILQGSSSCGHHICEECATVAADRSRWRQFAAQCAKLHGRN